ncbi:MAG: zinc-ribbon domain-containing protein [Anaerolineae bacterium]|jgi:hypothetical protein
MSPICPQCAAEAPAESRFCGQCGAELTQICPSCNAPLPLGVRFCTQCGANVVAQPEPTPALPVVTDLPPTPGPGITIEFPYSTAGSFDFAVREAIALPSYVQYGEAKKAVYRVNAPVSDIVTLLPLVAQLKGWRRRAVYVGPDKVPWDSVFGWQRCYEQKQAAYRPQFYCFGDEAEWQFNLIGCVCGGMPFRDRAAWCYWGHWLNKQGDWAFDKARIHFEVDKGLHDVRYCPALNLAHAHAVVDALPDKVNPRRDRDWQFIERWGESGDGLVMTKREFGFEQQVTMVGVAPQGEGAARKIMKAVAPRVGKLPMPKG